MIRTASIFLLSLLFCGLAAGQSVGPTKGRVRGVERPPRHPLIQHTIGVDHVLVWAGNHTAAEAFWQEKLGFRLTEKPGYYGGGVSNKMIWFENVSFIECLWLSDPELTKREAPAEYALVQARNGSNAFGVQVADADAAYQALAAAGLKPEKPGGEAYDPDGPEGPKPPVVNRWRYMFLAPGALSGNPFFVEYNLPEGTPKPPHHQPNGAKKLSAVWVLVRDIAAAEAAYARAHFKRRGKISLPHIGAEGVALPAGDADILLITPTRIGQLRERLDAHGDHVVGMSIQVARLGDTADLLRKRVGRKLARHSGPYGDSLLAPSFEALGVFIEFHQ